MRVGRARSTSSRSRPTGNSNRAECPRVLTSVLGALRWWSGWGGLVVDLILVAVVWLAGLAFPVVVPVLLAALDRRRAALAARRRLPSELGTWPPSHSPWAVVWAAR